ncbi:MAG: metalloregulator ArsR/SmtB family transcription factor [Gemmatimonadota bacterium]
MMELTDSSAQVIAERFAALAEPMRLRLLNALRRGEKSVGDLAEEAGASQANTPKHLQLLLQQGFVEKRKEATTTWYRVADPAVYELCSLISAGMDRILEQRRKQLRQRR